MNKYEKKIVGKLVQIKTKKKREIAFWILNSLQKHYVLQHKIMPSISQVSLNLWNQNVINKKILKYKEQPYIIKKYSQKRNNFSKAEMFSCSSTWLSRFSVSDPIPQIETLHQWQWPHTSHLHVTVLLFHLLGCTSTSSFYLECTYLLKTN